MKMILNREELMNFVDQMVKENEKLPRETAYDLAKRIGRNDILIELLKFSDNYI